MSPGRFNRATLGVPPPVLLVGSVLSVQFGGALAATLIPAVGPGGAVLLRLALSAIVLAVVTRPVRRGRSRADWLAVVAYAAVLGGMNLSFYEALARLPIGVAVTVEFVGPLVLSAVVSRRAIDLIAVAAAAAGVVLTSGALATPWRELDLTGLGFALLAGVLWAAYILTGRQVGRRFARLDGLAIALVLAGLAVAPYGLIQGGAALWHPGNLAKGLGVALLSSLVPYSLELIALRFITPRVFGILLSAEPAAAALAGLLVLDQHLAWDRLLGMALVVTASLLVVATARSAGPDASPAATPRRPRPRPSP